MSTVTLSTKLKFPKLDDNTIQQIINHPTYSLPKAGEKTSDEIQFRLLLEHVIRKPLTELPLNDSAYPNRKDVVNTIVEKWLKPNHFELNAPVVVQVLTKNTGVDRIFKRGVETAIKDACKATGAKFCAHIGV